MKNKLMKLFSKFVPIFSIIMLFPFFASAVVGSCAGTGISKFICQVNGILGSVIPLLIALAMVYFIWGVIRYVIADGEEAKKKGTSQIIYGLIGLTVIIGMWGLVNIIQSTFFEGVSLTAPSVDVGVGGGGSCTPPTSGSALASYLNYVTCLINGSFIPLVFALATVIFIWGVVKFFFINADEEAKKAQGKQYMIWGIIALTVMLSVWGLVTILGSTFGIDTNVLPQVAPH